MVEAVSVVPVPALTVAEARPDNIPSIVKMDLNRALENTQFPLATTYSAAQLTYSGSEITVSLFFHGDAKGNNPCSMEEIIKIAACSGTFVALVISSVINWDITIQSAPALRHAINDYAASRVQLDCVLRLNGFRGA